MRTLFGIIVVALSLFVVSCQKDQDLFSQAEELEEKSAQIVVNEISVDNAVADMNYESDFFIGAEGMMVGMQGGGMMHGGGMHSGGINWGSNNSMHYQTGQHPEYSMRGNQGQYPDSLVMNYGMGTHLNNGRVMSGSMIMHTSDDPNGEGFTRKITYDGFSVDSMSISGMTTIHISGDNQNGGIHSFTGDIIITMPDGTTIHRESEIVREWIEGAETNLDQTDDVMKVTGHVINTITENGMETIYRKDIVEPLIKPSGCRYFSQGVIELSQGGNVIATLDYGNGDCDDVAVVAKDGEDSMEIILSENDHCAANYRGTGMGMGHSYQEGTGNETGTGHGNEAGQGNGTGHGDGMGQGHGNGHGGNG